MRSKVRKSRIIFMFPFNSCQLKQDNTIFSSTTRVCTDSLILVFITWQYFISLQNSRTSFWINYNTFIRFSKVLWKIRIPCISSSTCFYVLTSLFPIGFLVYLEVKLHAPQFLKFCHQRGNHPLPIAQMRKYCGGPLTSQYWLLCL